MKLEELGLRDGINEVIATTRGKKINSAPVGIRKNREKIWAVLYPGSHTYENVKNTGILVANIVHDPVIFAISSFDDLKEDGYISLDPPVLKSAEAYIVFTAELERNIAYLEFQEGKILKKELRAVNRGFNAIIEACVHGTRYLLGRDELKDKIIYYLNLAEKCGGNSEKIAVKLIRDYLKL